MIKTTRFYMRCDPEVLKKAKECARVRGVPLSTLVDQYLRELGKVHDDTPKTDEELGVEQA